MSLKILQCFKELTEKDFIILKSIEHLMVTNSLVKLDDVAKSTNFTPSYVQKKIAYLDKLDLITTHRKDEKYIDVILNYMAYDGLALNELVKNNIIQAVGNPIGVGKESNVFIGILADGNECALKFHKLGKMKFKATKRKRDFIAEKRHLSRLYESTLNAKREAIALKKLAGFIPVPKIYGYNRHVIVMEKIEGVELQKLSNLEDKVYLRMYLDIISNIKTMVNFNFIHGDLSQYNILVDHTDENFKYFIIDWPQYTELEHPNSLDFLINDINNIYTFFGKKIKIENINVEEFANEIYNEAKNLLSTRR